MNILLEIEQAETTLAKCIASTDGWNSSCEDSASHLAELLLQADMQKAEMIRRLCNLGISKRAATSLIREAQKAQQKREQAKEDEHLAEATPICPHCLTPINEMDHFCPKCCGPVTAHASIDPIGQIYSTGRAYRQAVSGKPKLAVLVAMWLIFGPSLLINLFALYLILKGLLTTGSAFDSIHIESDGLVLDLVKLILLAGFFILSAAILRKTTARWLKSHD